MQDVDQLVNDGLALTKAKLQRKLQLNKLERNRLKARIALVKRLQGGE
jgi:hypothetical protein